MRLKLTTILAFILSLPVLADWYDIEQVSPELKMHEIQLDGKRLKIASHHYFSPDNKKNLVTFHGYLVNCGYLKSIHEYFFQTGYNITCYELPGHGKSEGGRSLIDNFSHYYQFFKQVQKLIPNIEQTPLIAHSTGCVGAIQSLLNKEELPFKRSFLIAPLVRNYKYFWTKLGYNLGHYFMDRVSRDRKKPYKNPVLYNLRQTDPYWLDYTPVSWVGKLIEWNNLIEESDVSSNAKNLTLYFAGKDEVVETPYNRKFLKQLVPNSEHVFYQNATHDIFYDPKIDQELFKHIETRL